MSPRFGEDPYRTISNRHPQENSGATKEIQITAEKLVNDYLVMLAVGGFAKKAVLNGPIAQILEEFQDIKMEETEYHQNIRNFARAHGKNTGFVLAVLSSFERLPQKSKDEILASLSNIKRK